MPPASCEDHDGQAVSEGNRGDTVQTGAIAHHGGRAGADEHEREGADEFGDELGCKRVWHC
jgi:hypothetical protein